MSTENITMLTVLCDVPNCTNGAQFNTREDACAAGWIIDIDIGREQASDYCPSCWAKINVGIDPNPVVLDRALADEVLSWITIMAEDRPYINDELQDTIDALKEAIEN